MCLHGNQNRVCTLFDYCDLYICISIGLVVSLLSHVMHKQPRVTFKEPSLKRWGHDKKAMEYVVESLLQETRPEVGQSGVDDSRDNEIDMMSVR